MVRTEVFVGEVFMDCVAVTTYCSADLSRTFMGGLLMEIHGYSTSLMCSSL